MALQDSEPWVSMLADLLTAFPATGQLNAEVSGDGRKIYTDLMADLKKTLKKHGDQSDLVLPLECHFLNKNAFISVVGHQPQVGIIYYTNLPYYLLTSHYIHLANKAFWFEEET